MGHTINAELTTHAQILDEMEAGVDNTSGRLQSVMRRVNKLMETTSGMYCFTFLHSFSFHYASILSLSFMLFSDASILSLV